MRINVFVGQYADLEAFGALAARLDQYEVPPRDAPAEQVRLLRICFVYQENSC